MVNNMADIDKLPYGMPLLFRTPMWFTLPSDPDVRIKLRPSKYKDIVHYGELLYASKADIGVQFYDDNVEIIADAIVDMDNTYGFSSPAQLLKQLSIEDKNFIIEKYGLISIITGEQVSNIKNMLDILYAKPLQDENWSCDACKHKKLQEFRACGFIPEEKRSKDFTYKLKGKVYRECPKNKLEPFIMSQAQEAHKLFSSGLLPEAGGVGDQTMWFIEIATMVAGIVREMELEYK